MAPGREAAPPASAGLINTAVAGPRDALPGIARSFREVQLLLLLVTALYYPVARDAISAPTGWFLTLLAFAATVLVIPRISLLRRQSRLRLGVETAVMVIFIAALIAKAGSSAGTLSHLFLLPVVTAALLLGRQVTVLLLGLIVAGRLLPALATDGLAALTLPALITLFAELAPTLLVAFLTMALASHLERATRTIRMLAERDELTDLYNLRSFSRLVSARQRDTTSGGARLGILLMIDVEQLCRINDSFGHEAGDRALQAVAEGILRATRPDDICARYGGDEFVVYLVQCTEAGAELVANRIRHHVYSATQDFDYAMRRLAVSIGTAVAAGDDDDFRQLLRNADRAMRQDKQLRRRPEPGLATSSA